MLAGEAVSWKSKQSLTVASIMEVEFVFYFEATSHGVWMKIFISRLKLLNSISMPLRIYCDNSTAVFFCQKQQKW